jgi:hypothetical protein
MLTALLLLIFIGVAAGLWFQGLWNNAITIINIILAGLIATNWYEPIASMAVKQEPSYTYLYDVIILWLLFAIVFSILRAVSDLLSAERIKFIPPVELAGRSVTAIIAAYLFLCFTVFTIHTAPLQANAFRGAFQTPDSATFLFLQPGQQWAAIVRGASQGSLSNGDNPFDPNAEFAQKHFQRRKDFEGEAEYRVN